MSGPRVTIDLERIEHNARSLVTTCRESGIGIFGVTKGTCGMPQVARAMLRGGVIGIGESRFENIRRLRASGIDCPILLLRGPPLSHIEEVIASVEISLNSEYAVIQELSRVAQRMSRVHDIILMVDLGDLREGIWPDDLVPMVEKVVDLPGIRIVGLGTNLTCFGAILPTTEKMSELVAQARNLEQSFGLDLTYVSGGNSSSLPLLLTGGMPAGVNNLRIGEAILQGGRDTFHDEPWGLLDRNAFLLSAELLEVKTKPSVPIGKVGVDAFGKRPEFEDRGDRLRGILNVGREDIAVDGLFPAADGIAVLGASSDHLVVDVADASEVPEVGDRLEFHMSYGALLAAMTSDYVEKRPMLDKQPNEPASRIGILAEQDQLAFVDQAGLVKRLSALGLAARVAEVSPDPEAPAQPLVSSAVAAALAEHDALLLLGKDHTISLAGLQGLSRAVDAFGVLWFDATASFLPPAGGEVALAGTVLYRALGFDEEAPGCQPQLSPENVALIGLRDAPAREADIIKESRVAVFTIADIDALGIREVMRQALHAAMAGTRGLYVSYCPAVTEMPGGEAGSGGITLRETHQAMEIVARTRALLAMDVILGGAGRERRAMSETSNFILSCFGKQIL